MRPIPQMEPWFDEAEANALQAYMLQGGWVTEFQKTKEFENAIAAFTSSKHCIATNNGTVSLALALWASGCGPGDEVLVPNLTMIATANAVRLVGATPVLVDVEENSLCMSLAAAEAARSKRTKALLYVAFNGRAGSLLSLRAWAAAGGIAFIEDAAQALGSFHQGKALGSFGSMGSFSFSAPKIISTGQGGAVVTDDDGLAERLRRLKDFGRLSGGNDIHDELGWNFKFTDVQAVIGLEQFKKLDWRLQRKRAMYKLYREALEACREIRFLPMALPEECPWFIELFTEKRDALSAFLQSRGIGSRVIYPPVHSQKIYSVTASFPVSESYSREGLWLPSSPRLSDGDIQRVCAAVREFFS